MATLAGVYAIHNVVNGKRYIGSAVNVRKRWRDHLRMLEAGSHHSTHLQSAWRRYGERSFRFVVLLACNRAHLICYEQRAINGYQSADDEYGYNISPTAGSQLGIRHTPETRKLMASKKRGKTLSLEHRANISAAGKQRYVDDPELRTRQSIQRRGHPVSPEVREKLSRSNRGLKRTPEQCRRNSESHKGLRQSDETIAKRAASLRLVFQNPEVKARLSRARRGNKNALGYKQSPEHIAKRVASAAATRRRKRAR